VVRLVAADAALMDAALAGDAALAAALGHPVVPGWVTFTEALVPTRNALAADPSRAAWGTRLFLSGEPPELVGWGGFKGPPDEGFVEIGYEIAAARRRQGLASAAVAAMLAEAFADARVKGVLAHTRPERNPSNHLLENAGFVHAGEIEEQGELAWRFILGRPAEPETPRAGPAGSTRGRAAPACARGRRHSP
jgi:RimJ/RimL family protein N-acetyltransferase